LVYPGGLFLPIFLIDVTRLITVRVEIPFTTFGYIFLVGSNVYYILVLDECGFVLKPNVYVNTEQEDDIIDERPFSPSLPTPPPMENGRVRNSENNYCKTMSCLY
jgi:hypothetical protein